MDGITTVIAAAKRESAAKREQKGMDGITTVIAAA
jgi:hypothetical protein